MTSSFLVALLPLLLVLACNQPAPAPGSAAPPATSAPAAASAPPKVTRSAACATQIALVCEAGFVDGCDGGLTNRHICVPRNSRPGPVCDAEIDLICPAGLINACSLRPPASDHHLCVKAP